MVEGDMHRDGFCWLRQAVDAGTVSHLLDLCRDVLQNDSANVRACSSRGQVYAARNLIEERGQESRRIKKAKRRSVGSSKGGQCSA